MSWKKYFTPVTVDQATATYSPLSNPGGKPGPARANYSSYLPDVYTGAPNRIDRYLQYDTMDMDSEVNAALDILAEFCSQRNEQNQTPFHLHFKSRATNSEITILREYLQQWCKLQKFDTRIFRIVRNVFKYGDSIFIRDPENKKWFHIDPGKLTKIIVNESEGKKPEQYVIRDLNPNFRDLTVTTINPNTVNTNNRGTAYIAGGAAARGQASAYPISPGTRFQNNDNELAVDAKHVIHISLSEGLDNNYPFGNSLLESVFKVYKQKELLEDAIIIYRIQRAPERRIFYIDVGNMPSHLAMSFVERVKNEIHQRRIPSSAGGGTNVIDSAYNPLSINEDYFFPQTAEGRGSKVETLPGGTNLGEIDDLKYFTNKLFRGLRIPSSYLPTGADDSQSQYNDGRVGTAYIQELRFNKYCERLQNLMAGVFDEEFKIYLNDIGVNIDSSLFELQFQPPQNFAATRQSELDTARAPTYQTLTQIPTISKRFAMKRFLGLSDEEIAENERLWAEENGKAKTQETDSNAELRSAGISQAGITGDLGASADMTQPPTPGMEAAAPGAASPLGGAPAAPAAPPV
jgi:Bacteriophage T4-like portal protein (Gp20)